MAGKKKDSQKAAKAENPPIAKMLPLIVLGVVAVIVTIMFIGFAVMSKKDSQAKIAAIDERVQTAAAAAERGRGVWTGFVKGEVNNQKAQQELFHVYNELELQVLELEKITYVKPLIGDNTNVEAAKRNAGDVCRAASSMIFSYLSGVQFRVFGPIGEGAENEINADRFFNEYSDLMKKYFNRESAPGLEKAPGPAPDDAEYVFVIMVDTFRADHVHSYGYSRETTPHIDKLASQGILFENAFSQCSTTDTSVASFFTGLYPKSHKMIGKSDWLWENMLVDNFRKAGYSTGGFSANSLVSSKFHFNNGFDNFKEIFWGRSTVLFNEAERWFEKARTGNDKIFTYIHLIDPHDLYYAPGQFMDYFAKGQPIAMTAYGLSKLVEEGFETVAESHEECDFDPNVENWNNPEKLINCLHNINNIKNLSMRDIQNMVARYDGEIRYVDEEIGRFVSYLERKGVLSKSTIIVMSDHGESFLEHNQVKHGRVLYDNETHVPLVIWRGKNNWGGKREAEPVENIDIMPTLMGMLGIEPPKGIHGRNLFGEAPPPQDQTFALSWNSQDYIKDIPLYMMSVRQPPFKYIVTRTRKTDEFYREEFYHIGTDPGELIDVSADYPQDFTRMKESLEWWNKSTDITPKRKVDESIDPEKMKRLKDLGYVK